MMYREKDRKGGCFMNELVPLPSLLPGQRGRVRALGNEGSIRRRLLDIGLIENTQVECLGRSPAGDPSAYRIRGAVIAIRAEDGRKILIERCLGGSDGKRV